MRTIVYQSYRTTDVPRWIRVCMASVRSWASLNGFEYRFIDDQLFGYAPDWFRDKANGQICPVSDLARLVLAKDFLAQGYARTVWVDADVVVFAPERLSVESIDGFAFCKELWFSADGGGRSQCRPGVNNAITVFTQNTTHLDFFIDACLRIARNKPQLGKLDVGTQFLSHLGQILPFQVLANVGMFNPVVMAAIVAQDSAMLQAYAEHLEAPLACANLCASLQGETFFGIQPDEPLFEATLERCLKSAGDVVNQFVASPR